MLINLLKLNIYVILCNFIFVCLVHNEFYFVTKFSFFINLIKFQNSIFKKLNNIVQMPLILFINLIFSYIIFGYTLFLWFIFPYQQSSFVWIESFFFFFTNFNIDFIIGVDSTSILMVVFTTFFIPLIFISLIDKPGIDIQWLAFIIFFLEFFLIIAFAALDLYLFYIAFEGVLIPMFFLIGLAGSRPRKTKAAFYLFFYTLIGSLFMLIAIVLLHKYTGISRYDILVTSDIVLDTNTKNLFFWLFFIAFAVKTPVFPFHLWLPEAHVEAPTIGSIILAGLLLKLGTYGMYRYCILFFTESAYLYKDYIITLMIISMFFTSLAALRQSDIKRIVAYSSIVHMSYCVIGLFSFTDIGLKSAFVIMISHGLVSGSLFSLVGVLYERYKTRFIYYYGGLAFVMPQTAILFFIAILGNISFPMTLNFVGEFGIFIGIMQNYTFILILITFCLVISTAYSIFLYNRIFFGALNLKYIKNFKEISNSEFFVNYCFLIPVFFLGIYPVFILLPIEWNISYITANWKII